MNTEDLQQTLGRTVTITVDRPIGSTHPAHSNIVYPVNYGYCKGILAGDGEEQDAYILGISEPLEEFSGVVTAVVHREDDAEDKWVVVPKDTILYEPYIRALTQFQEQYFRTKYVCLYEKVCGAVLYTAGESGRRYLLIKNESGHIGFPKGHVEYGETEEQTALREIYEETQLQVALAPGFRECYAYLSDGYVQKEAVYFLSEFEAGPIRIQESEILCYWLVSYEEAMSLLNYEQDKVVLERAEQTLRNR